MGMTGARGDAMRLVGVGLLWWALAAGVGCGGDGDGGGPDGAPTAATDAADADDADDGGVVAACADRNPLRNVYFGDLHVHTARSLDANLQGTRLTPADAYRFARGERVGIQPYDGDGEATREIQLARPLDFAAVTDHAEFLGAVSVCSTPGTAGYDDDQCVQFREQPDVAFLTINFALAATPETAEYPPLCGEGATLCAEPTMAAWREAVEAAAAATDRTDACAFTAFAAYEWSGNPGTSNLHRNVIFAGDAVPGSPIGYFDEPSPEGLWAALRRDCVEAGTGCEVVVIPHNSNLSTGMMFAGTKVDGSPIDRAFAAEQAYFEPLVEIMQHKGDSECLPDGPAADELCGFEKMPYNSLGTANLELERPPSVVDFVRAALGKGLAFAEAFGGVNPFAFGFVASTDTHIAAAGGVSEAGYPGHGGAGRGSRDAVPPGLTDQVAFNPGGLAAVWAEENRREAIFAGLRRRETYGTSGPRIAVRFFGGWGYPDGMCEAADFVAQGYAGGVPMGGTLGAATGAAPRFAVWARRDAGTAGEPGTALQRLQVVKGWLDADGELRVRVLDVAGDADGGASVDLETCEAQGAGADELCTVWEDDAFDAGERAFYYVRVLEDPTCRWHARQCVAAGVDCAAPGGVAEGFEGCCDARYPWTVQERAWSSPIWYEPPS